MAEGTATGERKTRLNSCLESAAEIFGSYIEDCRHAIRLYLRTPGASLIALVVLAISMGFVAGSVSLYVDLVLRPIPGFEQSSRITTIGQSNGPLFVGLPFEIAERISDETTSIDSAAIFNTSRTMVGPAQVETPAVFVSKEFFEGIRPRLVLGRGFDAEDHVADAEPVVVISYAYWQSEFSGNADVLGTALDIARFEGRPYQGATIFSTAEPEIDSAEFRVIGVTSPSVGLFPGYEFDFWLPLERVYPMFMGVPESLPRHVGPTIARRAEGASVAALTNEVRTRYGDPGDFPGRIAGTELVATAGITFNPTAQIEARRQLEMLLLGSVLLALVAAANVSLFLLARAPHRRRELGIRLAVGAPLRRIARQLATEAGLLVLVSAGVGLAGSVWLALYLRGLELLHDAEWRDVTLLDWRVLSLMSVLLFVLAVLVSVAPIIGIRRMGIAASSRSTLGRASLAQRLAGTAQIAIAGAFGGAAIAFAWYLGSLIFGYPGYETEDRYLVEGIGDPFVGMSLDNLVEFSRRRDAIEAIPGVTAVVFGSIVPGGQEARGAFVLPTVVPHPDDPASEIEVYRGSLEPQFSELLGYELSHGRVPESGEPAVVAVNQTLARLLWGRDDVVGERLPASVYWGSEGVEIVGVFRDLSFGHPASAPVPFVFLPLGSGAALPAGVIETRLTAAELKQALDERVADGSLEARVGNVFPLRAIRNDLIAPDRARGVLTMAVAALVVFLMAIGFYGMQRYLVATGRREYAIRTSLGAGPKSLGRLVYGRGLILGLPGLILGALLAFIAVAWLRDEYLSREVSPGIVTIAVLIGLTLLLIAASFGPAREARRTEPAPLLREN